MQGDPVHLERIVDGDASTATALTIYTSGTTTVRTLAEDEFLSITDVSIHIEAGGDYQLVADSAAGGKYIVFGVMGIIIRDFTKTYRMPYTCPVGIVPKFAGPADAASRNSCIVEGFISKV